MKAKMLTLIAGTAIAVVVGGIAAYALPAGAEASAASPPPAAQVLSTARTGVRGVTLTVSVLVTCYNQGYLSVTVTENVRDIAARGTGSTTVTCTGEPQRVSVVVLAQFNGPTFEKGLAWGQVEIYDPDTDGLGLTVRDAGEFTIAK